MWVYRSAKDTPQTVKVNGFKPWLEKQGRWDSGKAALLLQGYFDGKFTGGKLKSPMDFSRYIIASTKGDTVSTSKDRHCAGQGIQRGGDIYKILVSDSLIHHVKWSQKAIGTKYPIRNADMGLNPKLYLNTGCALVKNAKIILIVHRGEERTFLTKIPPKWVRFYKLHGETIPNENDWHEMWPLPSKKNRPSKPTTHT